MNSGSNRRRLLSLAFGIGMLLNTSRAAPQVPADIVGVWQGTIHGPRQDVRLVIKVAKADSGALTASTYIIDQSGAPVATSGVSLQGSVFKFYIPSVNASYTGQLNGNSITGTWTQTTSIPLELDRTTKDTAWEIPTPPAPRKRMPRGADPSFEVATIKLSNPNAQGGGFNSSGRNFTTRNRTLSTVMQWAYGIQAKQIAGGPEWLDTAKFDIAAVFPDGVGDTDIQQDQAALKKLMADRFKLTFHLEKREMSVYALTIAKSGTKLDKSESTEPDFSIHLGGVPGGQSLTVRNASMSEFAGYIQRSLVDRPVVDRTGTAEKYDFVLKWAPDAAQNPDQSPSQTTGETLPNFFEALQQELGLKLDPVKAGIDVLIIDHVEKPSEN